MPCNKVPLFGGVLLFLQLRIFTVILRIQDSVVLMSRIFSCLHDALRANPAVLCMTNCCLTFGPARGLCEHKRCLIKVSILNISPFNLKLKRRGN